MKANRLVFSILVGPLVLWFSGTAEGIREAQPSDNFYPVAVWYGGGKARAPMLEQVDATSATRGAKDLDQIKAVGFNTVKCWVDWATAEPRPGEYHFEVLNLIMRLASERGLHVIVQIYLDSAPDWVGERFPDGKYVDRSGAVIESQAAPGFCVDHAGVRAEVVKFIKALSREANRSKALYGWDVWSEPHVLNWVRFPHSGALPRLAEVALHHLGRAEFGVVPRLRKLGPVDPSAPINDSFLYRLHRLAEFYR